MRLRSDPVTIFLALVAVVVVCNTVLTDLGIQHPSLALNLTLGTVNNVMLIAILIHLHQREESYPDDRT